MTMKLQNIWAGLGKALAGTLLLFCCMMLTGCVDYQLGVNLDSPHQGSITQTIHIANEANPTAQALLKQIQQQTRSVQGLYQVVSKQDVSVTIPFHTVKELETKFNRFFRVEDSGTPLLAIISNLKVTQVNAVLFERDRLAFDIDLSALAINGTQGFVDPDQLFNLSLTVNGAAWELKAGKKNHIETALWIPMPLGFGAVAIIAVVAAGVVVRNRSLLN
ncbi:MAG: DUF3153 domain-containing protein [Cyanobacteria bacterium]|nr:DUF3153 domain-containing protein [Cyanobacteriota bacterium]